MSVSQVFDYLVVGGGVVGAATAYKLSLRFPKSAICMLEKEQELARHQTGRNSGVIHSGIYYRPGSLKARNCKNGREQLVAFAGEHGIRHNICGKIIVAVTEKELPVLEQIYQHGVQNETRGIKFLNPREISQREPFIKGLKGLWVPGAGIIDYVALTKKFVQLVLDSNRHNRMFFGEKVVHFERDGDKMKIRTDKQVHFARKVIVCGGLFSDRLAKLDKVIPDVKIVGFRGDYFRFTDAAKHKVKSLVYPVPDPKYPFLGVHFTPMVDGEVECGPNAVFTFKREGYAKTSFNLKDSLEALSYKGTLKLFAQNWSKGLEEYRRAFSKKLFIRELQKMMPSIKMDEIVATRSGVRAQAVGSKGQLIDDFKIIRHQNTVHVINAPSPAATACLSVADEILSKLH